MRIDHFISGEAADRLTGVLLLLAPDGSIMDANAAASACYGYTRDELRSMNIAALRAPRDPEGDADSPSGPVADGTVYETTHVRRDGTSLPVEVAVTAVTAGGETAVMKSVRDITEISRERDARRESEERLAAVFEGATDGIWLLSTTGEVIAANSAMARMHGYTVDEMLSMHITDLDTPQTAREAPERLLRVLAGERLSFESDHVCKDGRVLPFEVSASAVEIGGEWLVLGFDREITERRRSASVMEGRLAIAEYAADHELPEVIQMALDRAEAVTGSQIGFFHFVDEDQESLRLQAWSNNTLATQCTAEGAGSHYPVEAAGVWMDCVRQGQPIIHNDYASVPDRKGMPEGHAALTRELTVPLSRGGRVYAVLGVGNKPTDYDERDLEAVVLLANLTLDIVTSKRAEEAMRDSERWLTESQRVAELGHYIFDIEHDRWDGSPALFTTLGANPGGANDFAGWIEIVHPDDRVRLSSYFTDEVLGKGAPFDIEYRIVRPSDGALRWVHGLGKLQYAPDGHATAMFGIIQDVTSRKQTESELGRRRRQLEELLAERERNLERLGRSLMSIVEVVSRVVETRDPYTAGHQRRVSELAVSISEGMGLTPEQVEEIRIAALIHDVGKMSVPAEVLSKPGQLTPLEFELIKGHAEAGYRIIASADMEGPTAEIVYQHQERCDGSGYPRGLSADELLQGSKVIMVADVVEAMSSHRPYRSALGIDAALAEIEGGAGTLYDARVAQSCLKAFREYGFSFSEQ